VIRQQSKGEIMSALVISALAAAAFAAVPPSIGSEPVPANFDYVAAPAQQVAFQRPNLAASVGSEPTFFELDARAPTGAKVSPLPGRATLAASLGSEPTFIAFDEGPSSATRSAAERRGDERVACTCGRM
jgi:hypothetical protein